jgi:hypothetical protein
MIVAMATCSDICAPMMVDTIFRSSVNTDSSWHYYVAAVRKDSYRTTVPAAPWLVAHY